VTAEFAGEAAARAKRTADAGDHELGPAHPVERRIGEHRVASPAAPNVTRLRNTP